MKNETSLQQFTAWLFVLYYSGTGYLASILGWDFGYVLQTGLILTFTCLLPYYLMTVTGKALKGSARIAAMMLMPSALTLSGSAALYLVFTQLNFTDITPLQTVPPGMFPGVDLRS